jgi:hypothetical protein
MERPISTGVETIVLVEGESDKLALEALARRQRRDLAPAGVAIVAMGGATNIAHHVRRYGPRGRQFELAGLCDIGEEGHFRRALEDARLGIDLGRRDLEALGFFVCDVDLEDELLRALGSSRIEAFIDSQGDLGRFRTFQKQIAQRDRTLDEHIRRFVGIRSGRKARYAAALVDAIELDDMPRPLTALLDHLDR